MRDPPREYIGILPKHSSQASLLRWVLALQFSYSLSPTVLQKISVIAVALAHAFSLSVDR